MALSAVDKIHKEYKTEIDAAWDAMSKRFDRALKKRDRELAKLMPYGEKGEAARKRAQGDVPRRSKRPRLSETQRRARERP